MNSARSETEARNDGKWQLDGHHRIQDVIQASQGLNVGKASNKQGRGHSYKSKYIKCKFSKLVNTIQE